MTGFRADDTNQYPGCRIFVGKTYDSLDQIQQPGNGTCDDSESWKRGRMDSPMVSQSTAGRISESTTINENDVRLIYLLSGDRRRKREIENSSTMSLTDAAAKMTIGIRILVHEIESICYVREAQRMIPGTASEECQHALRLQSLHQ